MANEYENQKELIVALGNLIRNYAADGKDRKKEPNYYDKKIKQLDEVWGEFDRNDGIIRAEKNCDLSNVYFTDDSYERTKEIYGKQRRTILRDKDNLTKKLEEKRIENQRKAAEKAAEKASQEAAEEAAKEAAKKADEEAAKKAATTATAANANSSFADFNALIELQSDNGNKNVNIDVCDLSSDDEEMGLADRNENVPDLVKVYQFILDDVKSALKSAETMDMHESQGAASAQLDNLKTVWSEFRVTHREISVGENRKYCIKIDNLQSRYLKIIGKMNDMVNGNTSKQSIILPKIKLPEFDGEPTNWKAFKNIFEKIVHSNAAISNGIKIQYLKTNLTGKAAKMVEHLPATDKSYEKCYELLCNRYDNDRETVSNLIDEMLNIEEQKSENSTGIKTMHDTIYDCIMSIESMGASTGNWDLLLIQILTRKLHRETIMDYEKQLINVKENQSLKSFLEYLERRFLALMSVESKTKKQVNKSDGFSKVKGETKRDVPFQCSYCGERHSIYKCVEFGKIEVQNRFKWAKENKMCYVCLQSHARNECKSKYKCKLCEGKHNVLLHFEKKLETKNLITTSVHKNDGTNGETAMDGENVKTLIAASRDEDNLLATAMVRVQTSNGDKILARAVIDMGSQSALISEKSHQALGLKTEKVYAGVDGVDAITTTANRRVELKICSRFSDKYVLTTKALVLNKITSLNVFKDDLAKYDHLQNLQYADPTINDDHPIDILLNVADYARILKAGLIKGTDDQPVAQNTEFGWIIFGSDSAKNEMNLQEYAESSTTVLITNVEINEQISNFFAMPEIEDDSDTEPEMTEEEKFCEEYFLKTTTRDESGRFTVSMPFRDNVEPNLGESKKAALAILFQLENKFKSNPKLKAQYSEAIKDAMEKGHLVRVEQPLKNPHYIPHHAVFKDSTTTKLRTVYNASRATSNGKSLNDQLLIGRMQQSTIFELALRWRSFGIAIVADIEQMYKQIKLDEKQQHLQVILWRDETGKIQEYKMTTVTFGLANSPYLAIRWLKTVADAVEKDYPLAAEAIRNNFYVDDHTGGVYSVKEGKELYRQLKKAFETAGCNLRKFLTNSKELMTYFDKKDKENAIANPTKVLGILWDPICDTLKFQMKFDGGVTPKTKRQLVAEIATIYDPLGLISPVVVKAKILLQNVWAAANKTKASNWDDELPKEFIDEWMKIKTRSAAINSLSIKRFLQTEKNSNVQIHGYCDASERAYAACVYIRATNGNKISSMLLVAKSKNSPTQTIPKLELCGAKLLVQLVKKVRKALKTNVDQVHLWCDSTCVLGWIGANPLRYKKYVASRIIYINTLKEVTWHHIAGNLNPADCASRGLYGDELVKHNLWWNGPPNLCENVKFDQREHNKYSTENELKMSNTKVLISTQADSFLPQAKSFQSLKKVFAIMLRFVNNCRGNEKITGHITVPEIKRATTTIIKIIQRESFGEERKCIESGKHVDKKSKLLKLNVFADNEGIIRVGGRLKNANIPFNAKHQIILPKNNEATNLIIYETHQLALHAGAKLTEAILRQQYWVIDSQSTIKKELKKCLVCSKYAPKPMDQLMANLPEYRVNKPFKVFMNTAIDFAGPFWTKVSTLRSSKSEKSYVCVFVCMASRAMHLELVGNLTAESCVAALRRFIAKRGKVANFFSDNGTNFVKANKILQELSEAEKSQYQAALDGELLSNEINWHFSPPGSPHHNGLAEAAVKSMKSHLRKALGEKVLTLEEMHTLLCQIEGVVNARPMCALSNDPNDTQTITPAHFLQMVSMQMAPDDDLSDVKSNYLSRWQTVQKIFQQFWKQWKNEYLNQLQVRNKWCTEKADINVNDLVMLKDESLPSTKWSLGRIVEKYPGDDGLTRVVSVKTGNGIVKRTVTKVAPLPLKMNEVQLKTIPQVGKKSNAEVLTVLLGVFALITTTNAHEFTLIDNDQVASSNQSVNLSIRHSENYATYTVVAIFIMCFFAFLMFWLHILYRSLPANTGSHDIEMRTSQGKANTTSTGETGKQKEQQVQSVSVYNLTQSGETYAPIQMNQRRLDTPIPASRKLNAGDKISPVIELEREYYLSRRESFTASLYPHMDLRALQRELE